MENQSQRTILAHSSHFRFPIKTTGRFYLLQMRFIMQAFRTSFFWRNAGRWCRCALEIRLFRCNRLISGSINQDPSTQCILVSRTSGQMREYERQIIIAAAVSHIRYAIAARHREVSATDGSLERAPTNLSLSHFFHFAFPPPAPTSFSFVIALESQVYSIRMKP